MVYPKYGLTFRKIREQKQLSLSFLEKAGISKPALSKFERGQTMMSFEKVFLALQVMDVTLSEFEYILHDFICDEKYTLLGQIESALIEQKEESLIKLQQQAESTNFLFVSLAAKASYRKLTVDESEKVTDLLYEIKIWGKLELTFLYLIVQELNGKDIIYLFKQFFRKKQDFFNSEIHSAIFSKACFRGIQRLCALGYKEESAYLIEQLYVYEVIHSMFLRVIQQIIHGYWIYCFSNQVKGQKIMLKGLKVVQEVAKPEIATYCLSVYENMISSKE